MSDNSFKHARTWQFPSVAKAEDADDARTNALNKPFNRWRFEPPEEEQTLAPLTAEQIEDIRQAAYQEGFDSGKQEGYEAGYKEGYAQGMEKGLIDGEQQGANTALERCLPDIQRHVGELTLLIGNLQNPLKQVNQELKKEVFMLATVLASQIVQQQVELDDNILIGSVEKALGSLPVGDKQVDVYIHPEQLSFLSEHIDALNPSTSSKGGAEINILADETLQKGGCRVVSSNNSVDLSIKRRCESIFAQVLDPLGVEHDPRVD